MPFRQHGNAVEQCQVAQAVGYDKDHAVPFARDFAQEFEDFLLRLGVQPAGHLVAEEKRRLAGHLHGEGQPAPLPAREIPRQRVGGRTEPGQLEQFLRPRHTFFSG